MGPPAVDRPGVNHDLASTIRARRQAEREETGGDRPHPRPPAHLQAVAHRLAHPGQEVRKIRSRLSGHHAAQLRRLGPGHPGHADGRPRAGDDQLFHRGGGQLRIRPEKMRFQDHHHLAGPVPEDQLPACRRHGLSRRHHENGRHLRQGQGRPEGRPVHRGAAALHPPG